MIKLILIAALLLVSVASMAQKVVVGANGEAIIDCRDMPAKSITAAKKSRTTNATNSAMGTNDESNLASKESNKTVSHYFEVLKTDVNHGTWHQSFQTCTDLSTDNGGWRSPTQRELMLIWILHEPLKKVHGFTPFKVGGNHWAATDVSTTTTYVLNFANGFATEAGKGDQARMRCIRDLTPPAK